ncbi:hypothetical protein [Corynebacterium stationis]|uniref:Uncharacterized protein n=1 Tax=Corynebacterium stationis TaxID=1705 RepID=A0AB36CJ21_9CORY|nr:hypothetical protein [Corynebacterium stationis]NME88416.1 hypothetical protein [Corynebacterium stationis]
MRDEEILRRFIVRARRVKAHSQVQDWDDLLRHAEGSLDVRLDISGRMTFTRRLPEDEEIFESLVSRVRPLTLKSEPVYYVKVFDAINRILGDGEIDERFRNRIHKLRQAWDAAEIQGTQVQSYTVQSARIDGTEATPAVSDTQLAAAWLYADLVHADAQGPKKDALAFPLRERYAAAVRVFSHLAALAIATMELIELLRQAEGLPIDESAWEDDVVVGASELVEEGQAFVAPVGSKMPDIRDPLAFAEGWSAFTVTELLRQDPANQVHVVLRAKDESVIASYDAAVSRRQPDSKMRLWDVLVAGSVIFKFAFNLQDEKAPEVHFHGWEIFNSTNELKLASTRLMLQIHYATTITFEVRGNDFLTLDLPNYSDDELREWKVIEQTVDDIVAIEHLTGKKFEACSGRFDNLDRVRLRRLRLMLEGHIVHATRRPVTVTATEGNPPQVIVNPAEVLNVGGSEVPTPQILMRHPDMSATETGVAPDSGPEAKTYLMEPPSGKPFFSWIPGLTEVSGDEAVAATATWNLIEIDEATFNY